MMLGVGGCVLGVLRAAYGYRRTLGGEAPRGGFDQLAIESVKWCHAPAEAGDRIPRRRVGGF
jgi:hypothetical protein